MSHKDPPLQITPGVCGGQARIRNAPRLDPSHLSPTRRTRHRTPEQLPRPRRPQRRLGLLPTRWR
jgi:hypothetical protein